MPISHFNRPLDDRRRKTKEKKMSLFGRKVAESTPNEGGVYWLAEGRYLVEIDTVKVHEGRNGKDFFIVAGKNVESDHPERKCGSKCSWVSDLNKDATPGNIKMFLGAALGIRDGDLTGDEWEKLFDKAVEEDNPFCGLMVKLEANTIQTKAGNDFTKHIWTVAQDDGMTKQAEKILSSIVG